MLAQLFWLEKGNLMDDQGFLNWVRGCKAHAAATFSHNSSTRIIA